MLKPINTSIYDFPELITGGYVYVDKPAILSEIARPDSDRSYYLPRPRRFRCTGKSKVVSSFSTPARL